MQRHFAQMVEGLRRALLPLSLVVAALAAGWGLVEPFASALADETVSNPFLGQPDAIAAGDDLYHSHCIVCHGLKGGRGPNLFVTTLTDEQFLGVVINGRKGTQMPAWGFQLSIEDVWRVHAFVKAHPSGLAL